MSSDQGMILNLFLCPTGVHEMSWRHQQAAPERLTDLAYYADMVQCAERAKFHAVFLPDEVAIHPNIGTQSIANRFEPLTMLSALAATTRHIGLIGTLSTTFHEPYNAARSLATLDHFSSGRAGWNIVTTSENPRSTANYGEGKPISHAGGYERAQEFVEVAKKLWDSWEDEALVFDKASGTYTDTGKIRAIGHKGKYFSVQGPLNVARSPQGYPVLVQAGASDLGRDFAARTAEVVYTAQQSLEDAQAYYGDIKTRMLKYGRRPGELKVIAGISPVIAATESEAREKERELRQLLDWDVSIGKLSGYLHTDLSAYPPDGPLPELPDPETLPGTSTWLKLYKGVADRERLTIRGLAERIASGNGHLPFVGTPERLADVMEQWFRGGAADGFVIRPQLLPAGLRDFAELVVPELQRRGLYHTDYGGVTLRENLGLDRPRNSLASVPAQGGAGHD